MLLRRGGHEGQLAAHGGPWDSGEWRASDRCPLVVENFLPPLEQQKRQSVPLDLLRCYFYYCPPYISQEPSDDEIERMKEFETFTETVLSNDRWAMRLGKLQKRKEGNKIFANYI